MLLHLELFPTLALVQGATFAGYGWEPGSPTAEIAAREDCLLRCPGWHRQARLSELGSPVPAASRVLTLGSMQRGLRPCSTIGGMMTHGGALFSSLRHGT